MTVIEKIASIVSEIEDLEVARDNVMEDFAAGMSQREAQSRIEDVEDDLRHVQQALDNALDELEDED